MTVTDENLARTSATPDAPNAEMHALALDLTDTVVEVLGSPDGQRVTHHKGVVMEGTFTATPRAAELTRAAHMQGDPVRVTVRYSNGFPSADPDVDAPDATKGDPRGMAVKFYLDDGRRTDLVCQDWPVFPAGTPEDFRDLLRAQHEGPEATETFLAEHPDVAAAGAVVDTVGAPPQSWATMVFHSLNAFRLVNEAGEGQWVRWKLEPAAGEHSLAEAEWATADPDYLMAGVVDVLPITYRVMAQLARDDDQTTDASKAWPADREWVEMGTIEITGKDGTRETGGDVLMHDPMRLVDGIEPSDDPILRIRSFVYAESVRRRSGAGCPMHLR
ncbi:catalase family peroxidase [Nocardioides sp. CFH 31398]|uniref:catalase family peroxidase n=1 Tax=Nocardioides sp. CFH 31398 TaxID=2919579 RepID=UPI001F057BA0|nr:catalase family peroxidase [Nocardioides sp. CFH 31398]MCH1868541.1 catalase family peroxidase [Nocardioides sp. CFH 31398]